MMDLLNNLQAWHWALLGISLLILEIIAPGIFFMWMGLAAGLVALLGWLVTDLSWQVQVLAFAGLSIITVIIGRKWLNPRSADSEEPTLNRRGEQYIGRVFTLDQPIINNEGKIRVDDTTWKIRGADCNAGSRVRITGVDGVVLLVSCEPPG
jgi:membrane protein implicated in regulation of membrane protease activity